MHLPAGNGVRVDTAIYTGYRIPSEYDSMIAKVIVHAPDRDAALQKMRTALDEMKICSLIYNDQGMLKLSGSRCIQTEIGLQGNFHRNARRHINKGSA